jgi:hypothetical protein
MSAPFFAKPLALTTTPTCPCVSHRPTHGDDSHAVAPLQTMAVSLVPTLEPDPANLAAQRAQLVSPHSTHGYGAGGAGVGAVAGEGAAHGGHAPGGVGVDGLGLALRAVDAWPGARCDASPPCTLHHCAGASVSARCFLVQLYPLIRTDA